MNPFRSTGLFLLACSAICLIIAIERYQSAVLTAKTIAEQLDGIEFESVGVPLVSIVMGFVAVVLFAAGIRLVFESRASDSEPTGMLQVPDKS